MLAGCCYTSQAKIIARHLDMARFLKSDMLSDAEYLKYSTVNLYFLWNIHRLSHHVSTKAYKAKIFVRTSVDKRYNNNC